MKQTHKLGLVLVIGGGVLLAVLFYLNSRYYQVNQVFSPYTLLTSSWSHYKQNFILPEGRVIDPDQNDITTSEGQSYALLRAVWLDDRETFDQVWQWTDEILRRPEDRLFGWRWGELTTGEYGFLPDGGINSASDADVDIALALILAYRRWGETSYLNLAKEILADIWEIETAVANDKRYLIAGNWAQGPDRLIVNPSYFAPYALRIFAQEDQQHDWLSLVDPGYQLLNQASIQPLDTAESVGLAPNWVSVNVDTGELSAPDIEALTTEYTFDAVRVPWRIGLDYLWYQEPQAIEYLRTTTRFLEEQYRANGALAGGYRHDGQTAFDWEHPLIYATSLGGFIHTNPELAQTIFNDKILTLYANEESNFRDDLGYYEHNWLWFGAAIYHRQLFNYQEPTNE